MPGTILRGLGLACWCANGFRDVPKETFDAACIEGAGQFSLTRSVAPPQRRPVTAVVGHNRGCIWNWLCTNSRCRAGAKA